MYWINFSIYDEEAEKPGGDYWEFLNGTLESIEKDGIYLGEIGKIIENITNEELKQKMKRKVAELMIKNGLFQNGLERNLDMFSNEETKQLLEHEFNTNIIRYLSNPLETQHSIYYFISELKYIEDSNCRYTIMTTIINKLKNIDDKSILINMIERNKHDKEVYDKLINKYYDYFPNTYKTYLKMQKDPNYIYNKSLKFINKDIDIGIDPRISIGPEIEANIDCETKIDPKSQTGFKDWNAHTDASVPNGHEIDTSVPFHNKKEEVIKFCGICEAMREMGYYYNDKYGNAGGQINLGLDYLDTKEAIMYFYEIYCNCEELLYYISNEEGQLFRQEVYCSSRTKPISEIIGKRVLDEEITREDLIKLFNSTKHSYTDETIKGLTYKKNSVCLRGEYEDDYRLEFRIPNGGCNYRTWIDNIRLYGKMMEVAKRLADLREKDYLSDEDERLLRLQIDLQDKKLSLEEKLKMLMDLLFTDDKIKQIYYNRYNSTVNKIKETNAMNYTDIYGHHEPNFNQVEFELQYQSRLGPDYKDERYVTEYNSNGRRR